MPLALELPVHMQAVALEEMALLKLLKDMLHDQTQLPADVTLATRNELIEMAQKHMHPEDLPYFLRCADMQPTFEDHDGIIDFPLPVGLQPCTVAEELAEQHLQEGSGSLWNAARMVARTLQFENDPRDIANGCTFRLGLFCKGGITGLAKSSTHHVAASRLFNQVVREVAPDHTWTSLSISVDNGTTPHVDSNNTSETSLLVGLTHHSAGHLWIQDNSGDTWMEASGVKYLGTTYATARRAVLFNSRLCLHGTLPWQGTRCVLLAYTVGSRAGVRDDHARHLEEAGYQLPSGWGKRGHDVHTTVQRRLEHYFNDTPSRADAAECWEI
ncbi:unnamed protein product [Symbiodinium sp. CCMP2592]|nr:unnamed protein product [Symbiodinium sp. CCMP2592]